MEIKEEISQKMELVNRAKFTVDGVNNVVRLCPDEVLLKTSLGGMRVGGSNLKLEDLSKQNGGILITGKIDEIIFEEIKEKRNYFKDLFK